MYITSLYLKNFRVYEEAFFHFDEKKIQWILGPNAKGKTSLLEALFFFTSGKSFRTKDIQELIQKGKDHFILKVTFYKNEVLQTLTLKFALKETSGGKKGMKEYWHNEKKISPTELPGIFLGVSCHPDDMEIIKGSPSHRRNFLDIHISQYNPLFVHHLKKYEKALKEKNALLKNFSREGLSIFEDTLAKSGSYLILERIKALQALQQKTEEGYVLFCGRKKLSFEYASSFSLPLDLTPLSLYTSFLEAIEEAKEKEKILKMALIGPQRDSFHLFLDEKEMKYFSSEGEKRSLLFTLKKAEWNLLKEKHDTDPLLFIDDAGQNLDISRQSTLKSSLKEFSQVFLTTTHTTSLEETETALYL